MKSIKFINEPKKPHQSAGLFRFSETPPPWGEGRGFLLLVQGQVNGDGNGNGSTDHRVVTNTQEAHHLNVSGH